MHKKIILAAILWLSSQQTQLTTTKIPDAIQETHFVQNKVIETLNIEEPKVENVSLNMQWMDFNKRVILPIQYLLSMSWSDIEFDKDLLLLLWIIENMWSATDVELENTVSKFAEDKYKDLHNVTSPKWARWIWQIMPWTRTALNDKYWVQNIINANRKDLIALFWLSTNEDFKILRNWLYAAFLIKDIKDFLRNNGYDTDYRMIAGVYNMWPAFLKTSYHSLNWETKKYLEKAEFVEPIIKNGAL